MRRCAARPSGTVMHRATRCNLALLLGVPRVAWWVSGQRYLGAALPDSADVGHGTRARGELAALAALSGLSNFCY
jgi:hypothetical protein